jgi:predicted PurR-regulated permease PerM
MNKKVRVLIIIALLLTASYFILRVSIIRDMLKLLLISYVLAYSLRPIVRKLVSLGVNRKIAALLIIVGSVSFLLIILGVLIPSIIKDGVTLNAAFQNVKKFIDSIYVRLQSISSNETVRVVVNSIYKKVNASSTNFFNEFIDKVMHLGENILSYVVIPVIVYYFLSENDKLLKMILVFVPLRSRDIIKKIGNDIDKVLTRYIVSQFILCLLISVLTLAILIFLKVDYPFLLALLNGIFNIIPYFGPIFGAIPSILMALVASPQKAVWVAISMYFIQQIEGDIISPKITGDSVSIHPLGVILLLLIGGKVGGFVGMILAVPIGVIIKVIYEDLNYYLF